MTVTPVGLNQQVYMGNQNGTVQPVQQNASVSQPIPVGQPVPQVQQVPQGQQAPQGQQVPQGNYPVIYPNISVLDKLPQSDNSYDNDVMMNGIDFEQLAQGLYPTDNAQQVPQQTQQTQQAQQAQQAVPQQSQVVQQPDLQTQQVPVFTGNPFEAKPQEDILTNCLVTPEKNETDGAEKKFKLGPTIGAAVGLAAPFVCNKARLGKFLTKDLLVKAPVISAGGLCAGGMAEGLVASAKKLEADNVEAEELAPAKMDAKA